jgi:diadenosine tetraphosphate (Ap4A) HIT family hydrolase
MVIMNIFPYNTGHLQVIPVKHATALEELDDKTVSELFVLVKKCLKLLKKVLGPEGFNIGINQGENVAGASIPHLHIHIVPRYRNDFGFMEIIAKTKVLPESVDETYEKLLKNVKILG